MKNRSAPPTSYSLEELCALVELPKRTVRYYIQRGLVDRPEGGTRAARYGPRHLEQLVQIRRWTQSGVSLARIREWMADDAAPVPLRARGAGTVDVWTHIVVAEGVEITLQPRRAGIAAEQAHEFSRRVHALYEEITRVSAKVALVHGDSPGASPPREPGPVAPDVAA